MEPLLRSTAGMTANLRRGIAEFGRNEDTCEEDPRMRSRKLNQSRRCGPIPLEPPESTLSSRPTKLLEKVSTKAPQQTRLCSTDLLPSCLS